MDKLKVFSKKLGEALNINENPALCGVSSADRMIMASWSDGGWSNYSYSWLNSGWNNYSGSWQNSGWNNYSGSWVNSGWNNYSYSWSNSGWNNYSGGGGK